MEVKTIGRYVAKNLPKCHLSASLRALLWKCTTLLLPQAFKILGT